MFMDSRHHIYYESEEAQIVLGSLAGREEHVAAVGAEAPVIMLARAVYARERFLVHEYAEIMAPGHFGHKSHHEQVVVVGQVGLLEYGGEFKLIRSHLVVSCLKQDAELVCLGLEILHERADPRRDCSEIMVFKLLVFCGCVSDHCPACKHEVRTGVVQRLIYKEVLLLDSEVHLYRLYRLIEEVCHRSCCLTQDM